MNSRSFASRVTREAHTKFEVDQLIRSRPIFYCWHLYLRDAWRYIDLALTFEVWPFDFERL